MYKLTIERTQLSKNPPPLQVTNFLLKIERDQAMFGAEEVYDDRQKTLDQIKFMHEEFQAKVPKKSRHKMPRLKFGTGSSHVWIHIDGDNDRVAVFTKQ